MRKIILIAAIAFVSVTTAQASDSRSLTLAGVDEKVPAALGKAADTPKVVEAPKAAEAPQTSEVPKTVEAPKPVEAPRPVEAPKAAETPKTEVPAYIARPTAVAPKAESKSDQSKAGQVTFEDSKPVVEAKPAVESKPAVEKDKRTARSEKPRRKHYWNEARIMRELSRYGIYW